jgi:hypothetical protein
VRWTAGTPGRQGCRTAQRTSRGAGDQAPRTEDLAAFAEWVKRRFPATILVFGDPPHLLRLPDQAEFRHERLARKADSYVDGVGNLLSPNPGHLHRVRLRRRMRLRPRSALPRGRRDTPHPANAESPCVGMAATNALADSGAGGRGMATRLFSLLAGRPWSASAWVETPRGITVMTHVEMATSC